MGEPTTLTPVTDRSPFSLHPEEWVTQRDSHDEQTYYFKYGLRLLLPDCFVARDLGVYWVPGQTQYPWIGPDNFVSRHQPRVVDPKVWLTYEDGPLALVIEVASDATRSNEEEKRHTYARELQVPEYLYVDLQQGELWLGRLAGGEYERLEPDAAGRLWSAQFRAGFAWDEDERFVRLVAPDGSLVAAPLEEVARREEAEERELVAEERAVRAIQRAEQQAARARQAAARAEQEAARRAAAEEQARELAAEVERLRQRLGEA